MKLSNQNIYNACKAACFGGGAKTFGGGAKFLWGVQIISGGGCAHPARPRKSVPGGHWMRVYHLWSVIIRFFMQIVSKKAKLYKLHI